MLALLRPLVLSLMPVWGACVAPGSGETGAPGAILSEGGCAGQAPACIFGCAARADLGRATCEDSVWHCERGVRRDLCCDPAFSPEQCPAWGDACARGCAAGYTCVTSRSWPLPSAQGVCRLGDWSIPEPLVGCGVDDVLRADLLPSLGTAAIKLDGVVSVSPSCDDTRCTPASPCCQRCVGSYALELAGEPPLRIGLRTETVACVGDNCGFSCAPLQPGRHYLVWGRWVPDDGGAAPGALYVAGSCAD